MVKYELVKAEIQRVHEIAEANNWSAEFTLNCIMAIVNNDYVGGGN